MGGGKAGISIPSSPAADTHAPSAPPEWRMLFSQTGTMERKAGRSHLHPSTRSAAPSSWPCFIHSFSGNPEQQPGKRNGFWSLRQSSELRAASRTKKRRPKCPTAFRISEQPPRRGLNLSIEEGRGKEPRSAQASLPQGPSHMLVCAAGAKQPATPQVYLR